MRGGAGDDVLTGGAGADTLTGGAGADIFVLGVAVASQAEADTITDFAIGDQIQLPAGITQIRWQKTGGGDVWLITDEATPKYYAKLQNYAGYLTEAQFVNKGLSVIQIVQGDSHDNSNLRGSESTDQISGAAGNDILYGYGGNDRLQGDAGADVLYGGTGNDSLHGGAGNDTLSGGAGDDRLNGGAGDDRLNGGTGNDEIDGGSGTDSVRIQPASHQQQDNIILSAPLYVRNSQTGQFTLHNPSRQSDVAKAQSPALYQRLHFDSNKNGTIDSGEEVDYITNIEIFTLEAGRGTDNLTGGAGIDNFNGGAGNDTLHGGAGNDTLSGGAGNDTIIGGPGDDVLSGGTGTDILRGLAGNDVLSGGAGADTLDGGEGNDTASYANARESVLASLATDNRLGDAVGDTYTSIENLIGSVWNDVLYGDSGANILDGGAGSDILHGLAGIDTVSYKRSDAGVTATVNATSGNEGGHAQGDRLYGIENLTGSDYDDALNGDGGVNILEGGKGADKLDGGANNDFASYAQSANGVFVFLRSVHQINFAADTNVKGSTLTSADANKYIIAKKFESVWTVSMGRTFEISDATNNLRLLARLDNTGTAFDSNFTNDYRLQINNNVLSVIDPFKRSGGDEIEDQLVNIENLMGSNQTDRLEGNTGNNTLIGLAGDDDINGFAGNDILNGGAGNDTLGGGDGDDILIGGAGGDLLVGDDARGATGNDTASYETASASVTASLSTTARAGDALGDTYFRIENLTGSDFNDTLIGDSGANILTGRAGNDILRGLAGNDTLIGGAGNDTVSYESSNAGVTATVNATSGNTGGHAQGDQLYSIENLTGSDYDDQLTGDANSNILEGGKGADMLDGKGGNDFASYAQSANGVIVSLRSVHQINFAANSNIKGSALTSADANKYIIASKSGSTWTVSLGSTSESNDSDTRLLAKLGSTGTALDSSFDNDWRVNVNNNVLSVIDPFKRIAVSDEIEDQLVNIESLIGSEAADFLFGDAGNNTLIGLGGNDAIGGHVGNDILNGGAGNDVLRGGAGNDILIGGAGGDTLIGDDGRGALGNDTASYETASASVTASLSTTARAGDAFNDNYNSIENLTGSDYDDTLIGDQNANILTGRAGNDILRGLAGNDVLIGGAGKDTLTGGAGNDVFDVSDIAATTALADIITDFGTGSDDVAIGSLTHIWFQNSTAVTGVGTSANDTILYAGNADNSAADSSKILAILTDYTTDLTTSDFTSSVTLAEIT